LYTHFRSHFLQKARKKNLDLVSFEHPEKGPEGEALFTDYAIFHPVSSDRNRPVLIHLSGLHGVEGYLGSLAQQKILDTTDFSSVENTVVFVHAVNPFGMAWFRRTNASNVDLNRNCWRDSQPPLNTEFAKFENYLRALETGASFRARFEFLKLLPFIAVTGMKQVTEIITRGQSIAPQSVFYSGEELQPELISLIAHLQRFIPQEASLRVIDVHTGFGPYAAESLIVDGFDQGEESQFWSKTLITRIIDPSYDPRYYRADGVLPILFKRNWQRTHYVVQEFGTYAGMKVLKALAEDEPEQTLRAFFPDDPSWRNACLQKALLRFSQYASPVSTD
jgi:hypothetical protein